MQEIPMKPSESMFTDEQWEAIHYSGKDLLLAASAGSGKTRVLVERVLAQLKKGRDINQLLIVTFTRAAAKEMKDRLRSSIQKEIHTLSDRQLKNHFIRQLSLMNEAQISTIHSFCGEVIQRFYYLIDLDPVFNLMSDETETAMIQDQVWADVRESYYSSEDNEAFIDLARRYATDRSDEGLTELVMKLYQLSRSQVDPEAWLENIDQLYRVDLQNFYDSALWRDLLQVQIQDILTTCLHLYQSAMDQLAGEESCEKLLDLLSSEKRRLEEVAEAIACDHFSKARSLAHGLTFQRWSSPRKADEDLKERIQQAKSYRDQAKTMFTKDMLESYFIFDLDQSMQMTDDMQESLMTLIQVVHDFSTAYQDYKVRHKLLDFNDQEHLCYQILQAKNEDGLQEAADFYQSHIQEVLIDEYQDTNLLQENILSLIVNPDEGSHRFMVGDVKQSIYRFRMAEPGLFMDKYKRYGQAESKAGHRVILQDNFRSRKEVLDFVNLVFKQLMDERVGEMTYDQEAELVAGFKDFPESDHFQTEFLLYCDQDDEASDTASDHPHFTTSRKSEIMLAGQRIQELVSSGFLIYDKDLGEERPIRYQDIVILSRNKGSNFDIQMIFQDLGIPSAIPNTENYFQSTEVSIMMAVLKLVDNPRQDLPMAAVLRSPIVGLDENDLADIRIHDKSSAYYQAYKSFVQSTASQKQNPDLHAKLSDFDHKLESWRKASRRTSISKLIGMIYQDTGYLDYVVGMPGGEQRRANLLALYELAVSFEENKQVGLYAFIVYIERMLKKDQDLNEPQTVTDEDAVRVMTIHNSKGLEFPVVIILNLSSRMNPKDYSEDVIFDRDYGMASKYIDPDRRVKASSLQSAALAYEVKRQTYSEEMRVLYVALTRAEQKLILIGHGESKEKILQSWRELEGHDDWVMPAYTRLSASNMMQWLGMSIIRHRSLSNESLTGHRVQAVHDHPAEVSVSFYTQSEILQNLNQFQSKREDRHWFDRLDVESYRVKSSKTQDVLALMDARYDYPLAVHTTSYQSVSEIKRVFDDPNQEDLLQLDPDQPTGQNRYVIDELERPTFIVEDSRPTPAEIGMGTHLLMQSLDFSSLPEEQEVRMTMDELVSSRKLKKSVADEINLDKVLDFLSTDFAQRMVRQSSSLRTEVSFSLKLPAERIFDQIHDGESILIHGITDGYFEEDGELVLFDYKTDDLDRYADQAEEAMLEKYRGQLNLYQLALENILEKRVKESYLILLDKNLIVQVNA